MTDERNDDGRSVGAVAVLLAGLVVAGLVAVAATGGLHVLGDDGVGDHGADRETGHDPPDVPSQRVHVVDASLRGTGDGTVESVALAVESEVRLDLSNVTVEWLGPSNATTLAHGDAPGQFDVVAVRDADGSAPVLNDGDRFRVVLNASAIAGRPLGPGETVELKLVTVEGAVTPHSVTVSASTTTKRLVPPPRPRI